MTDEVTPNTETVEPAAQAAAVTEEVAPIEEPFDKDRAMSTIHSLREIEKKAKQDAKELAALKAEKQKQIDATLSETDRLKKQADDLAKDNAKLQAEIICNAVGLPATFAERLKGTTREEMQADAEALVKSLPQAVKPTIKVSPTNPANAQSTETEAQKRARIFGQHGNVFDADTIRAKGGGVFLK